MTTVDGDEPMIPRIHSNHAARFADATGRGWRVALAPDADDVLVFVADDTGEARQLYDFPLHWWELTTLGLRELLAHTALSRDSRGPGGKGGLP